MARRPRQTFPLRVHVVLPSKALQRLRGIEARPVDDCRLRTGQPIVQYLNLSTDQ